MRSTLLSFFVLLTFTISAQQQELQVGVGLTGIGGNTPLNGPYAVTHPDGMWYASTLAEDWLGRGLTTLSLAYSRQIAEVSNFSFWADGKVRYNTGRFEPADQYIDGQPRSFETQTFQSLYLDIGGRVKFDLNSATDYGWNVQVAIFGSYYAAESLPTFSYGDFSYDMSEVISEEYRNSFVGGFNIRVGRDWQKFGVYLNYDYRGAYFKYSPMLDEEPGFSQGMSVIGVYRF